MYNVVQVLDSCIANLIIYHYKLLVDDSSYIVVNIDDIADLFCTHFKIDDDEEVLVLMVE